MTWTPIFRADSLADFARDRRALELSEHDIHEIQGAE
jgi:hypothetical protein